MQAGAHIHAHTHADARIQHHSWDLIIATYEPEGSYFIILR